MEQIFPSYARAFHCLAGACPDTCCQQWEVTLDAETAARYLRLPGALGDALRAAIRSEDGEIWLENHKGRCPMLRPDGLCRIQATLGEDALCQVCQEYPRITQDYGSFVELCLEMSCPEAARLILETPDWTLERRTLPIAGDLPDYDTDCMHLLQAARPRAFSLLRDTRYSVQERLALLLCYGQFVQQQIDASPLPATDFDPAHALQQARRLPPSGDCGALFSCYRSLELLCADWGALLEVGPQPPRWTEALCRYAAYGVYRYFYQAVSDYDLLGRICMLVSGCILTAHLNSGLTHAVLLQRYAKEIENNADNVDALLDAVHVPSPLNPARLLSLLAL